MNTGLDRRTGIPETDLLDARETRVLQKELPGLRLAFDPSVMRDGLQAALLGSSPVGSEHGSIVKCEPAEALYLPGECCIVRYRLLGTDRGGEPLSALINGRVYPDHERARAYYHERLAPLAEAMLGRGELAGLATPAGLVEKVNATVAAFPIDGELPTLVPATDPDVMLEIFRRTLPEAPGERFEVEGCEVELVRYRRQHGCLLRYRIQRRSRSGAAAVPLVVYGKIAGGGEGALTGPALAAIEDAVLGPRNRPFTVPQSYGFFPELQLVLMESISGVPQVAPLLKARLQSKPPPTPDLTLEEAIDQCGSIAAMLHASGISIGPRRDAEGDLRPLEAASEVMLRTSPPLGRLYRSWVQLVIDQASASRPLNACFSHGDFKYTQLVFDGRRAGLVDFDTVAQAEPALDLGHFCAYLRLATVKAVKGRTPESDAMYTRLRLRFIDAYVAAGRSAPDRSEFLERVRLYERISLLRLAFHAWQRFKSIRLGYLMETLEDDISKGRGRK